MAKYTTDILENLRKAEINEIIKSLNDLYATSENTDDAAYDNKELMQVLEYAIDMDGRLEGIIDTRITELTS